MLFGKLKSVGDPVRKGETLLTVEANESLKTYSIVSSLNGVITQRNANPGEQTSDAPIEVKDFSTVWVELSIFPAMLLRFNRGRKFAFSASIRAKPQREYHLYCATWPR